MKKLLIPALLVVCPILALAADKAPHPFVSRIEKLDAAFDNVLAADAKVEKLAEGFRWSEGPSWYVEKNAAGATVFEGIVFSDVLANTSYKWAEGWAKPEVFLRPSGLTTNTPGFRERGSNGMQRDTQGRLIICQHGDRRVVRFENGAFTVLADKFEGKRFNSPNDATVAKNGDIYFTDPPYGLEGIATSPLRELTHAGVYKISAADGKVSLLTKDYNFPNGICMSPDEKTLYVASTDSAYPNIGAHEIKADGTLGPRRDFFKATADNANPGLCDGLEADKDGNIYSGAMGGVIVVSPAGKLIGRIHCGEHTSNIAWGNDGSTLYITADYFVARVKTKTKGLGW